MSSMSGIGGSGYNPLAALYQQLFGNVGSPTVTGQTDPAIAGGDTSSPTTSASLTGSGTTIDPSMFALLVALQEQQGSTNGSTSSPPNQQSNQTATLTPREQQLFNAIDTNGDGQISQSELENAVTSIGGTKAEADALFAKLDSNGDGSVSTTEFAQAMPKDGGHHHMHMGGMGGAGGEGSSGGLLGSSVTGDTTETVDNPDGSTTTTVSYADGTTVTVTTPAAATASGSGNSASGVCGASGGSNSNSNGPTSPEAWIETLIRMQAQMIQSAGVQPS